MSITDEFYRKSQSNKIIWSDDGIDIVIGNVTIFFEFPQFFYLILHNPYQY